MSDQEYHDKQITEYLLGRLSEEDQRQFEQHYFADDELYDRLCIIEEELIDNYVTGSLTPELRALCEKRFQISPLRERVRFAEALKSGSFKTVLPSEHLATKTITPSFANRMRQNFMPWALAAAVAILALG